MPLLFIEMIVVIIFVTITLASQRKDRSRAPAGLVSEHLARDDRSSVQASPGTQAITYTNPYSRRVLLYIIVVYVI